MYRSIEQCPTKEKVMGTEYEEWREKYSKMRDMAERILTMRIERARRVCRDAGLDPGLLGIHPHNAMMSFKSGHPWPEANYSKVRLCLRILNMESPHEIIHRWDKRIRGVK